MRKVDYILEKFNEFEELTSKAQLKPGKFMGPELRPSSPFKFPGVESRPTIPETHKMVTEPHKMVTEPGPSEIHQDKIKIIKTPQGKFVVDKASIPSEWWDTKGNIKPEFEKEWNKARAKVGVDSFKAAKTSRLNEKRTANINKNVAQLDSIADVSSKMAQALNPNLNFKNVYSAFKKLAFIGVIAYIWAGSSSKPKSADKSKQKAIDTVYSEMETTKASTMSSTDLKLKISDLSSKLGLIKAKTPAGQNMVKTNITNLNNLLKILNDLGSTPSVDNAAAMQAYANKSNTMLLDGLDTAGELDQLSSALQKSNKQDLSILCDEVSNGIKDNVVFIDSVKESSSQGAI